LIVQAAGMLARYLLDTEILSTQKSKMSKHTLFLILWSSKQAD